MPEYTDTLPDSGVRVQTSTGALRERAPGKGRYDLITPIGLRRLAKHYENGAKKYGERNWEKGMPIEWFLDSAIRHLYSYLSGDRSEDHLAAAAWNALGAAHMEEVSTEEVQAEARPSEMEEDKLSLQQTTSGDSPLTTDVRKFDFEFLGSPRMEICKSCMSFANYQCEKYRMFEDSDGVTCYRFTPAPSNSSGSIVCSVACCIFCVHSNTCPEFNPDGTIIGCNDFIRVGETEGLRILAEQEALYAKSR